MGKRTDTQSMYRNYQEHGVENYYREKWREYKNFHESNIKELLIRNIGRFKSDCILDLCSGGGEVTKVLLEKGINNISGADPYTFNLYIKNTGKECIDLSFKDILRGRMDKRYTTIICSFALHLVDEKSLSMVVNELFKHTETFIIIAPHKRPFLERIKGVNLIFSDYSLTHKGKKVYMRGYVNKNYSQSYRNGE